MLVDPARVPEEVPLLGLSGAVLFPAGTMPLALHTPEAVAAARAAAEREGLLAVALRRAPGPAGDVHRVATLAAVRDLLGGAKVRCSLKGLARVELAEVRRGAVHLSARVRVLGDAPGETPPPPAAPRDVRLRARLAAEGPDAFPDLPLGAVRDIARAAGKARLADLVLANLPIPPAEQQRGLAERNVETRLALASSLLDRALADVAARRGVVDEAVRLVRLAVWRAWLRLGGQRTLTAP